MIGWKQKKLQVGAARKKESCTGKCDQYVVRELMSRELTEEREKGGVGRDGDVELGDHDAFVDISDHWSH